MDTDLRALFAQSLAGRADAEKQLEALQQSALPAAFLRALCEQLLLGNDVAADERLLASIWLKHFCKRNWKATRAWREDERAQLRQAVLAAALEEPHAGVALQLALVVATIARGEFPAQWPFEQLFPPMLQALQAPEATPLLRRRRCLDVTYRLAKELATRRLMVHRKQFAMLAVELLPLALHHWRATALALDAAALDDHGAMLLTNTKLLSTLLLNAFRDLAMLQNGELVRATLVLFYEQLERLVALRVSATTQGPSEELLDKICFRMARLVVGIQKAYPVEFRAYLAPFLSLFWNVLALPVESNPAVVLPKRLQIEAIQFFSNVLSCRLYKSESLSSELTGDSSSIVSKVITAAGDVSLTDVMVLEAQGAIEAFFASDASSAAPSSSSASSSPGGRLERLLHLVVMHYMKLQPSELEEWQSDPEAFVILSESLTAQESVRACAEDLFLTLLQMFPQQTIPVLTQLTAATAAWLGDVRSGSASAHARVLDIDAVLLALGLGCYDLHECFEFEPWFLQHLVPLLVGGNGEGSLGGVPVLPYRVVWLVSCWLAQLSAGVRAPLYDALLNAAASATHTDAALQLRIVQTLEAMVSDWGFERAVFVPFLPRALARLYAFFPETSESESKMKVLGCLDAMLQACGADVVAVCEQVSAPLPAMWNAGGEAENLVRGQILQLLAKLLGCVRESAPAVVQQHAAQVQTLHAMCLQVVRFATDVSNPDEVFLMENGLELWTETLEVAPAYSEELHALFGNALRLMDRDYEHAALVLSLLALYVKLGGAQFWQTYHAGVAALLEQLVGSVKAEASLQVARALELLVARFPTDQLHDCVPVAKKMVAACLAYTRRHEAADPRRDVEPESVVVAFLSVFARALLQHLEFAVVHVLASDMAALVALLDLMLDKFFAVVAASMSVRRRKVWALGLCAVLDLVEEPILERLGPILEACADVLDEEQALAQDDAADKDDAEGEDAGAGAYRAYQTYRKKKQEQAEADREDASVAAMDLRGLARAKLAAVNARVGDAVFAQMLQTVDASVLARLQ